jgi:hypothetical protein
MCSEICYLVVGSNALIVKLREVASSEALAR